MIPLSAGLHMNLKPLQRIGLGLIEKKIIGKN